MADPREQRDTSNNDDNNNDTSSQLTTGQNDSETTGNDSPYQGRRDTGGYVPSK